MIQYYVWYSQAEKSWLLDYSGNEQTNMVLIKSFKAKNWANAQKRFNKIRKKKWKYNRGFYRGRGLFKQRWYSICSKHWHHNPECGLCGAGTWHNIYRLWAGSVVYKVAPDVWRWWANRGNFSEPE